MTVYWRSNSIGRTSDPEDYNKTGMTENLDQLRKKWWERFAEVVDIETTDPVLERKGKILAL